MTREEIWREPLTDNERSFIQETIRLSGDRNARRWMNFMLKRIDAAEAHIRELQLEHEPDDVIDPIILAKPNWPAP